MVNPLFILHILALFAAARAMAISPNDATVTDWRESSLDDIPVNSPRFIDPAIVLPVPTSNERVVLAAFSANSAIAKATCTLGETASCINISVLAVLSTFLGLFQATSNGPIVELGGGSTLTLAHPQWQPTADCRLGCQLRAGVADGEWRLFAHLVIDGAQHALHSFRSGSTNGLKAIPVQATAGASTERRSDVYDAGGIVAAYFWDNGNQQAWATWDSGANSGAASLVSNYIVGGSYAVICVDLGDATGNLDAGLMTIGVNNTEIAVDPEQLPDFLNTCAAGE